MDGVGVTAPPLNLVDHPKMGARERAFGALLALKAGWRVELVDMQYDPLGDTVVVTVPGRGQTWSFVRSNLEDTLAEIERRFGADVRAAVGEMLQRG